ncbi:MAG: T9SS type A sorting domain-containing protein [Bacteroidota bacterium]
MKKIIFAQFLALFIGMSSLSFGSHTFKTSAEDPTFQVKIFLRPQTMKIDVFVEGAEGNNLKVSFLDAKGRLMETKRMNNTIKGVRIDISNLKDGVYQVKITDGVTEQIEKVELETSFQRNLSLQ